MQETIMRAAAYVAGSIVAIGAYLAVSAAFGFTPAGIALGVLVIALLAAVGIVAGRRSATEPGARTIADPFDFA
jgi:hypothetical protein